MFVIIPITRYGSFPEAAVSSLLPISDQVKILASFNRAIDPARDQQLLQLLNSCRARIIHTPRLLSPASHFRFIVVQAKRILAIPDGMPSVILCDDDRLLLKPEDVSTISATVRTGTAVWGPFQIERSDGSHPSVHQAFFQPTTRQVHSRLERLSDEMAFERNGYTCEPRVFASITGLVVPFAALWSAASFLRNTLSHHGARAEMIILAYRNLSVSTYLTPIAAITFHPAQAGLDVREASHLRSEIRFRSYALLNCSSLNEFLALMRLGFTPRWFWRAILSTILISIPKGLSSGQRP